MVVSAFKRIALLSGIVSPLLFLSCRQQDITRPVAFDVRADSSNVFRCGVPVHFRFDGDADYIVFYSGEKGHEYVNRNRTSIPMDSISSIQLDLEVQPMWGREGGMRIFVTDQFEGLKNDDGAADRARMAALDADGMPGWTELPFKEPLHGIWSYIQTDIKKLADNFTLAFHWQPKTFGHLASQRSYNVNGRITMNFGKGLSTVTDLRNLDYWNLMMNKEDPPYLSSLRGDSTRNGAIFYDDAMYAILFQGCTSTFLPYEIDAWSITKPRVLNLVEKDKGVEIKSIMNPIVDYAYTWDEPGTYKVVFVGVNNSYQGRTEGMRELTVIITDTPLDA